MHYSINAFIIFTEQIQKKAKLSQLISEAIGENF